MRLSGRYSLVDIGINVAFAALFVWAYIATAEWPFRAALFPRLAVAIGASVAFIRLGKIVVVRFRRLPGGVGSDTPSRPVGSGSEAETVDDIEYAFAAAGPRSWLGALGWLGIFFGGLQLLGILVIVPVFCVLYLAFVGRIGWFRACVYAFAAWLFLHGVFGVLLGLRLPEGIVSV